MYIPSFLAFFQILKHNPCIPHTYSPFHTSTYPPTLHLSNHLLTYHPSSPNSPPKSSINLCIHLLTLLPFQPNTDRGGRLINPSPSTQNVQEYVKHSYSCLFLNGFPSIFCICHINQLYLAGRETKTKRQG